MCQHQHFIIHKPYGYLSQFINNQNTRRNKKLLGTLATFPENIMAIGRLDEDSEGLLLLTTNGKVSEQVRSKKVEKEYYVQLDGDITDDAVQQLQSGVEISIQGKKYMTLPCKAKRLEEEPNFAPRIPRVRGHKARSWVSIIITEGKFRQVRKMTAGVGFPVLRLVRVRIGHIMLDNLVSGGVIEVENFDINENE